MVWGTPVPLFMGRSHSQWEPPSGAAQQQECVHPGGSPHMRLP
jgi:hypothetical protein